MNKVRKNSVLMLAGLALLGAPVLMTPAVAENVTQSVALVRIDVQKLSSGYRTSKIIGSDVVNDTNETIGKVDDLIVSPDDNKTAYVIISVGGWLGMGTHLVALPYSSLQITAAKITLPGATKEGVKNLPEFKYITT
jgi:sporulation protein YlmC with PRC-barrel domain